MKSLIVELSTPAGPVFAADASSIDVRTEGGCFHLSSGEQSFLNLIHATEITCRTADGTVVFALKNAVAGLSEGTFTVLAESIRRIQSGADAVP